MYFRRDTFSCCHEDIEIQISGGNNHYLVSVCRRIFLDIGDKCFVKFYEQHRGGNH